MQTKPLRGYGIDVTYASMQPILDGLGIDKQVKELSQAEKEILRYIATLRQGQVAMGDFANTVESPANQLKVFKQQLAEAKIALSNLFIGTFAKILPYANAILMVVKEVAKAIATMLGIEVGDYNTSIATQEGVYDDLGDSIGDVGSSADKAKKKVKELKREILGFDQINNINEPKDTGSTGSSGSGGGIAGTGIDKRLLDAIKGYDNGMDKIKMKATQIRDKLMEWLGFHKEIDPLTGETVWKYDGISKTLNNMWKSFKGLSTQGKILVGLGLAVGAVKLWNTGKKLVNTFGNSGLGKVIIGLISPTKNLFSNMLIGLRSSHSSITGGIQAWRTQQGIINETTGKVDGFKGVMNGAKVAMSGFIISAIGLTTVKESIQSASKEGFNLANSLGLVGGSLATIAGGAQIGAVFGPMATGVGAAAGAVSSLMTAIVNYTPEADRFIATNQKSGESIDNFLSSIKESNKAIEEQVTANLTMTGVHKQLLSELESITDANGNVKKGYEDRAKFILGTLSEAYGVEYELVNGQIKNYSNIIGKIKDVIKAKEAEILLEANKEQYAKDLQAETELWSKKEEAIKKYNEVKEEYQRMWDENDKARQEGDMVKVLQTGKSLEKLGNEVEKWGNRVTETTNEYQANIERQNKYSNLQEAVVTGNYKEIQNAVSKYKDSYVTDSGVVQLTLAERLKKEQETANITLETYRKKYGEDIPEALRNGANSALNEVINSLVQQTNEVKDGNYSKELIDGWSQLGTQNKDAFLKNFKKLPTDVQQQIVDKMQEKGKGISSELQKGIKKINPEINIKSKVDKATIKIDADTSAARKKTNNWLGSLFDGIGKFLGLKEAGGVYLNGVWKNIPQYANGGLPNHGSMFVAGEKGAEIVGHINGRTEVLNQSQIASAIYTAVATAMSQYGGGGIAEINVHASKDVIVETAINGINQTTHQTGSCPIDIPIN